MSDEIWNSFLDVITTTLEIIGILGMKILGCLFAVSIYKWFEYKYPTKVEEIKTEMEKYGLKNFNLCNYVKDEQYFDWTDDEEEDEANGSNAAQTSFEGKVFSPREKANGARGEIPKLEKTEEKDDDESLQSKTDELLNLIRERKKQRNIHLKKAMEGLKGKSYKITKDSKM